MEVTATKGQIIKGKPVADQISENLIKEVDELVKEGINPKLAIVRVGARGDDLAYERGALKRCQTIGIETEVGVHGGNPDLSPSIIFAEFIGLKQSTSFSGDITYFIASSFNWLGNGLRHNIP